MRDDAGRSSVSPDGKQIAFVSGRKEAEIWVMGSEGQDARRVAAAGAGERFLQVQWSPDGHRVAFMKSSGPGNAAQVSVENLDPVNGNATQMFSSAALQSFCWTADGKLFLALQEAPPNDRDTNLWQANAGPDGKLVSPPKQITKWAGFSFWDLSATADGTRLAFVKSGSQADVYAGKLDQRESKLADVSRLTLNEHNDWPSAWTADGHVLFYSDRNGHFDLFKQRPGAEQAEQIFVSSEDKLNPEYTADGKWLLFWQLGPQAGEHSKRMMKLSAAGGAVSAVLEAQPDADFHCAASKPVCVLAEPDLAHRQAVFSRFKIESAAKSEIARTLWSGGSDLIWSLNADGSVIALKDGEDSDAPIRVIKLPQGETRDYPLKEVGLTGIASAGNGWLLTMSSLHGNEVLFLSGDGSSRKLWSSSSSLSAPVVSKDGRMVALGLLSQDSNAWLLQRQ